MKKTTRKSWSALLQQLITGARKHDKRKGELKQIRNNNPPPPQADTNSAGIKVKPEPSKVSEWNDLYGEFRKYFNKGKIVIK